jgi:hypothetical protein
MTRAMATIEGGNDDPFAVFTRVPWLARDGHPDG